MGERERLLQDETAAEALLRWADRHQDAFARAIALSRMTPDRETWSEITTIAESLGTTQLERLDDALGHWPDWMRHAPHRWFLPSPRARRTAPTPLLRVARRIHVLGHIPDAGGMSTLLRSAGWWVYGPSQSEVLLEMSAELPPELLVLGGDLGEDGSLGDDFCTLPPDLDAGPDAGSDGGAADAGPSDAG